MTHEDLIALNISEEAADAILKMHVSEMKAAADELSARHNDDFFNHLLDEELKKEKVINPVVAKALLDMDTLKAAENREEAIHHAVSDLKKNENYLFQPPPPPPYACGQPMVIYGYDEKESAFREAIGVNSKTSY